MSVLKRHSLLFFFILAFLLSWIVWGVDAAEARGLINAHIPSSLAFWALTAAAFAAAGLSGGWGAVKELVARMLRWRVSPAWYAVALLLFPLLCLLTAAPYLAFGGRLQPGQDLPAAQLPLYFLVQIPLFLATEETAWRGFALPRLQQGRSALSASLILGLIWGVWHTPLFLTPGQFQEHMPFLGFVAAAVGMSVLTTWVFNHTSGSVLLTAILHAVTDASIAYSGVMRSGPALFWAFVGVICAAAVIVVLVEGPQRLARGSAAGELSAAAEVRS